MYNVEKYIQTCLDSIFQQTFKDFEVIIVDDCSTDRSLEIIESYHDSRIKLHRNVKNLGAAMTRNRGLSLTSESKYIYFMDSDDAIVSQTIETLFNSAEELQSEVVYMNSRFIANDPNFKFNGHMEVSKMESSDPTPRFLSENMIERLQHEFIGAGIFGESWIKIQRRDFLLENQIVYPDVFCSSDLIMNLAILLTAKNIRVIDFCGYIYRQNPDSISHSSNEKYLRGTLDYISKIVSCVEKFATNLSLENQMILEAATLTPMVISHFVYSNLSFDEKNQILQKFFDHPSEMNPEIFRAIFESFMLFATECINPKRKSIFNLKE